MDKLDLKGVTLDELCRFIKDQGEPQFRTKQILDWLYNPRTSNRVNTLQEMSNLGKNCIGKFAPFISSTSLSIFDDLREGTAHKYILKTADNNFVPVVLAGDRLILSTQIGCSYNCRFCASGRNGLIRNLSAGEIIDQIIKVQNHLGNSSFITKVEFAGMGEPLDNYKAVIKAIEIIRAKWGLNFYLKNISLATCGLVPQIEKLAEGPLAVDLVISLHTIQDDIRSSLMPIGKRYSIEMIIDAVKHYNRKTGCAIAFDYILMEGLNDSLADAKLLAYRLRGVPVKLRVSSYNHVPGTRAGSLTPSRSAWREQFVKILTAGNINAVLIDSFGENIKAGYGQLKIERLKVVNEKNF